MKRLSFAAATTRQMSTSEAEVGRHPLIEAECFLLDIYNLEKSHLKGAVGDFDPISASLTLSASRLTGAKRANYVPRPNGRLSPVFHRDEGPGTALEHTGQDDMVCH